MSERKIKRRIISRHYKRSTAYLLRQEGKTLQEIASYLNIKKEQVSILINEYERVSLNIQKDVD